MDNKSTREIKQSIINAHANKDHKTLYHIIGGVDFSKHAEATQPAMESMTFVGCEIFRYRDELIHFVNSASRSDLSAVQSLRFDIMKWMLDASGKDKGQSDQYSL